MTKFNFFLSKLGFLPTNIFKSYFCFKKFHFSIFKRKFSVLTKSTILDKNCHFCPKAPFYISHFPKFFFDFWPKFAALTKILSFDQKYLFFCWPKLSFVTKNFFCWAKFPFLSKILFLTKILSFAQNSQFCPKFSFLTPILSFDQNSLFWPQFSVLTKILFLTKISIFDQYLPRKFPILTSWGLN